MNLNFPRFRPAGARSLLLVLLFALLIWPNAKAFPPAPPHVFFGQVRDEYGAAISGESAEVILHTATGAQLRARIRPQLQPGVNYQLEVPMDSGITDDVYRPTALRPAVPFTLRVRIGRTIYLPIEMTGDLSRMGEPGERTRLDLTLGEDTDGDGLPDAWERLMIERWGGGRGLQDIRPDDDPDGNGLSNLQEYLTGTYAFDPQQGFTLKLLGIGSEAAEFEFMTVSGRSYSIVGSADLERWVRMPFKVLVNGASGPERVGLNASEVRLVRVAVSVANEPSPLRFFKLMVE
jgi:hypothetical protein